MANMEGWWTCCGGKYKDCGREVNKKLNGETCPDCGHEMCDTCESVKVPTPVPRDHVHQQQYAVEYRPDGYTRSSTENYLQQQYSLEFQLGEYSRQSPQENVRQDHYADSYHPVECTPIPPMRGWWRCCNPQCGADNNPATVGYNCPNCDHDMCDYCYVWP